MLALIAAAAAAVAMAPPPWKLGEEITTAADFNQACATPTDPLRSLPCVYFFRGALAMAVSDRQAAYDRYGISPSHRLALFCPPGGVTTFQLLATVTKAIAASGDLAKENAAKSVVNTLQKVYPCQK